MPSNSRPRLGRTRRRSSSLSTASFCSDYCSLDPGHLSDGEPSFRARTQERARKRCRVRVSADCIWYHQHARLLPLLPELLANLTVAVLPLGCRTPHLATLYRYPRRSVVQPDNPGSSNHPSTNDLEPLSHHLGPFPTEPKSSRPPLRSKQQAAPPSPLLRPSSTCLPSLLARFDPEKIHYNLVLCSPSLVHLLDSRPLH